MCDVPGCPDLILRRGLCKRHYTRWLRHGDPEAGRRAPKVPAPGDRHGRLIVVEQATHLRGQQRRWLCACDCGGTVVLPTSALHTGNTRSCGCLKSDVKRAEKTTHGMHESSTYGSWTAMQQRCLNPNHKHFVHYGGRGITVADRWIVARGGSFENFLADMGERPPGKTIDRIDPDGNYEPSNCRWATASEQRANLSARPRP